MFSVTLNIFYGIEMLFIVGVFVLSKVQWVLDYGNKKTGFYSFHYEPDN